MQKRQALRIAYNKMDDDIFQMANNIFSSKLMIFFRWLMLPQLRRARSGHKMVVTNGKLTVNLDSTKGHQDLSWLLVNIIRRGSCNNNFKCNYCDMFSHFLKVLGNRQYNQQDSFKLFLFYLVPMHHCTTFDINQVSVTL